MKKKMKWGLIVAGLLGITTAVAVPTAMVSSSVKTNVASQTVTLQDNSIPAIPVANNSNNNQSSIQQIIDAINKKFHEMLEKNGIYLTYENGAVNIVMNAQKAPKMQHMTAVDVKNIDVNLVVDIIQHTLISMGILPADAQMLLTVKDLTFTDNDTTAHCTIDMVWSNQLPVQHFTVNVQINNLYPTPPQTETSVQTDDVVGSNTLAWTLAGVIVGFGLVCLLATIIYIQIRKVKVTAE